MQGIDCYDSMEQCPTFLSKFDRNFFNYENIGQVSFSEFLAHTGIAVQMIDGNLQF